MLTARIIAAGTTASVYSPFAMRDVMRSIPGGRWNPDRKCWLIDALWVNMTADALRQAGCDVRVTDIHGRPWNGSPGTHGHRGTPAPDWITAAFNACPVERVAKLKRSLLSVFHPDLGGDPDIARQIIEAAEHRERQP